MEVEWKYLVELDQRMKSDLARMDAVMLLIDYEAKLLGRYCCQR